MMNSNMDLLKIYGLSRENAELKERVRQLEGELAIVRANLTQVEMQRDAFAMKLAIYGINPSLNPWSSTDNKVVK